nr:phage integrase SAM-like domain-containing protein [Caballeronia sp. AZ1_KS37]
MIYVRLYVEWLEATGRTEQTVKGRAVRLERFVGWCEVRGLSQPEEITRAVLEAYQRYLYLYRKKDGKPLSIRTQETMLTPLRGWCKWLARERYVQYNAASELVLPRAPKLLPRVVLSVVQVERLAIGKLKEIHAATHPAKLTASLLAAIDAEADEDAQ